MSREPEGYRLVLEQLNEAYPNVGMLTRQEVADFIGCSAMTVRRNFAMNEKTRKITKADLARQLCSR